MYSQNSEEAAILKILGGSPADSLLDIGAFDGADKSNTLALIERGWGGVLVEPSPGAFAALARRHEGRRNLELLNVAIGPSDGQVTFYDSPDLVSTTVPAHRDKWSSLVKFSEIIVPQMSPETLLAKYPGPYAMVNIDTEGMSADLFFCFLPRLRPKVWMVEHDDRAIEMSHAAAPFGYRACYLDGNNLGLVLG